MQLSQLYIYPIKSLGAISLQQSKIDRFGLQHDRRWMLVDEQGQFVTQRRHSELCFFDVSAYEDGFRITNRKHTQFGLELPLAKVSGQKKLVTVWNDTINAELVDPEIDELFSQVLGQSVSLVKMPVDGNRQVDPRYAPQGTVTAFSDGFPLLLIGQSSLDHLNAKLQLPIDMLRFRPNLVFTGGEPHFEDTLKTFQIGPAAFQAVKPCSRCVVTTIDPESALRSPEPLRTLSKYRLQDGKVMFGMNVLALSEGFLQVGDSLSQ
ncbi:MAG: MOSC domain-containing protein [Marinilabiliaceae bacterium]|nr:MOSC domain-containing protein [Marinilabiliaceae bacterium]